MLKRLFKPVKMESSDLSKVFGKMGSLISDFANKLSTEMDEKFGKVGKYLDKLSLTGEQKMELISLYKKLSNEESSLLKDLIKRGDKDGLKLLLSKYLTDENIIEAVIASSSIWKETTDIGKNLEKDITDILKDINKDEDNIFNSMGEVISSVLKGDGLENVDMKQVRSIVGEVVGKIESEEIPNLKENTEKLVNSIEENLVSQTDKYHLKEFLDNIGESFQELSKKQIRQGLIDETVSMIEKHKKLSDDINLISKTLTPLEIEILRERCGELPLDFRLRMMENTIQKLDSKLNSDSEKSNEIEELSEKIDDISVNLDLLITQLSRLLK